MTYDPIPDLAALIDGLHDTVSAIGQQEPNSWFTRQLADLLTGPYARLRGGLLLDEPRSNPDRGTPGWEHISTAGALRYALAEFSAADPLSAQPVNVWPTEAQQAGLLIQACRDLELVKTALGIDRNEEGDIIRTEPPRL